MTEEVHVPSLPNAPIIKFSRVHPMRNPDNRLRSHRDISESVVDKTGIAVPFHPSYPCGTKINRGDSVCNSTASDSFSVDRIDCEPGFVFERNMNRRTNGIIPNVLERRARDGLNSTRLKTLPRETTRTSDMEYDK